MGLEQLYELDCLEVLTDSCSEDSDFDEPFTHLSTSLVSAGGLSLLSEPLSHLRGKSDQLQCREQKRFWNPIRLRRLGNVYSTPGTYVIDPQSMTAQQEKLQERIKFAPLGDLLHESQLLLEDVLFQSSPSKPIGDPIKSPGSKKTNNEEEDSNTVAKSITSLGWLSLSLPKFKRRRNQVGSKQNQLMVSQSRQYCDYSTSEATQLILKSSVVFDIPIGNGTVRKLLQRCFINGKYIIRKNLPHVCDIVSDETTTTKNHQVCRYCFNKILPFYCALSYHQHSSIPQLISPSSTTYY